MYEVQGRAAEEQKYERTLERICSQDDCWGDWTSYTKCGVAIGTYEREQALATLKQMILKYELEIDEWAYLRGERFMQEADSYDMAEDEKIIQDLSYLGEHIPAYALLREGRAEEAEMLMNWIAVRGLTIGKMIETGCLSF